MASAYKPARAVNQYDYEMNFIRTFLSIQKASVQTLIPSRNISRACKTKATAGGYCWRYRDD